MARVSDGRAKENRGERVHGKMRSGWRTREGVRTEGEAG